MLEVRDLHKDFGGVHALAGASFYVEQGTITGLIGPNGAGKSTLINLVSGFTPPGSGQVVYDGEDITGHSAHQIARLGLVRTFQLSSEFARLTVIENLLTAVPDQRGSTVLAALRGKRYWRRAEEESVARAREFLGRFGLTDVEDLYGAELSGGQKRLLEISRALMGRPRVLLLDEPFAGVNPTLAREVEDILRALRDEGMTIVLVEHEMGAIDRLCDTVVVMAAGTVLAEGSMAEIRENQEVVDAYLAG
ncbi:MAG: ABC transporter ATP-binding protein [Actinobacteria bacterium]|nr:ABC transporter ATP-binding protein [Actinomycetota bacterium]